MITQRKLGNYLALTLGAGAAATTAQAATTVTLYGPGAVSPLTFNAEGGGFNVASPGNLAIGPIDGIYSFFTDGSFNFTPTGAFDNGSYLGGEGFYYGAQSGGANYANIRFDGEGDFDSVGQFFFDGTGGGYLIAVATNDNGSALSITEGKAAIDAGPSTSAVPEPSSQLALLALGSAGLLTRRRKTAR
jgi:hypothetical protein